MRPAARWFMVAHAVVLGIALAGCGKPSGAATPDGGGASSATAGAPAVGVPLPAKRPGATALITKNTVRLGAGDPAVDAAAVARAVYPGLTPESRPNAVALVDSRDWRTALAASVLMSSPLGAPLLFSNGTQLPSATQDALRAMAPKGASRIGGGQVIRIGAAAAPSGYAARSLAGPDPVALAAAIEQLSASAHGSLPRQVLIVNADGPPGYAMPAAALSAESGAPILFVTVSGIPADTRTALSSLQQPTMYVVGPRLQVGPGTIAQLQRFGTVKRVSGRDAVTNAIAVARYTDGSFGWGVRDPGHGLVFVNGSRPLDAAAAAPLSASGDYGPLLLLDSTDVIPPAVSRYLTAIQPGFSSTDPRCSAVRAVYNRAWLIGDQRAISDATQTRLDALLEISPNATCSAPQAAATGP